MKKLLSLLITTALFTSVFAAAKKAPTFEPLDIDYVNIETEHYIIQNNPAIEVIGIIGRFAEYDYFTGYYNGESSYTTEIDTLFAKFKDHKAVTMAKSLKQRGLSSDALISLAHYIKPDFSGLTMNLDPFPATLEESWKKIRTKEIYQFVSAIYDFAANSPYQRYVLLKRGNILESIGYYQKYMEQYFFMDWLNSFFKVYKINKLVFDITPIMAGYCTVDQYVGPDGKLIGNIVAFPSVSFYTFMNASVVHYFEYLSDSYWEKVEENFTKFLEDTVRAKLPAEDAEKLLKETPITKYDLCTFISSFIILDFYRYPPYAEFTITEQNPYTYDMAYNNSEKNVSAQYFYDIMNFIDDYRNNIENYDSFGLYFPKIVSYLETVKFSPAQSGE